MRSSGASSATIARELYRALNASTTLTAQTSAALAAADKHRSVEGQDHGVGSILGARSIRQRRTSADSGRLGRAPLTVKISRADVRGCSVETYGSKVEYQQPKRIVASPDRRSHHKPVTNAAVVSILVSVALVLPYSPSDPGRRLRSLRTARTLVNSGEGDLESVSGSSALAGSNRASSAGLTREIELVTVSTSRSTSIGPAGPAWPHSRSSSSTDATLST